jgi:hypothetical protein
MDICVVPKPSTQPCWLRCLARGRAGFPGSCLTKPKNDLHRQLERVKWEFIEIKKYKGGEKSPQNCGGGGDGKRRCPVVQGFYPFSPRHCSVPMLIRCAESSILIGCACKVLIGRVLIFPVSSFWSFLFLILFTLQGHREVTLNGSF